MPLSKGNSIQLISFLKLISNRVYVIVLYKNKLWLYRELCARLVVDRGQCFPNFECLLFEQMKQRIKLRGFF